MKQIIDKVQENADFIAAQRSQVTFEFSDFESVVKHTVHVIVITFFAFDIFLFCYAQNGPGLDACLVCALSRIC